MSPEDYENFDLDLVSGRVNFDATKTKTYLVNIAAHPLYQEMLAVDAMSMLHVDTLMLLRAFALEAKSGTLEVGPYIGGSTIAIGKGFLIGGAKPFVSIDVGGAYADHPQLPSTDIHADWAKNVAAHGVAQFPQLYKGWSNQPDARAMVEKVLDGRKIDLFFYDADGNLDGALATFGDLFADDCLLVLDDHHDVVGTKEKELIVAQWVAEARASGKVEEYARARWSTWFGRLLRK